MPDGNGDLTKMIKGGFIYYDYAQINMYDLTLVMALSLTSFVFADEVIDVYVYNNSGA